MESSPIIHHKVKNYLVKKKRGNWFYDEKKQK